MQELNKLMDLVAGQPHAKATKQKKGKRIEHTAKQTKQVKNIKKGKSEGAVENSELDYKQDRSGKESHESKMCQGFGARSPNPDGSSESEEDEGANFLEALCRTERAQMR